MIAGKAVEPKNSISAEGVVLGADDEDMFALGECCTLSSEDDEDKDSLADCGTGFRPPRGLVIGAGW